MCDSMKGGAECVETANSFASMTQMFGKSFHANGLREACDCVSTAEAPARFKEYVSFMYTEYNKQGLDAVPAVGACKVIEGDVKGDDKGDVKGDDKECTNDEKVEALLAKYKGKEGKLFWKLVNTYKHINWVRDGPEALATEECEVAERDGKRFGE
jgi:hypothetical protein